MIKLVALLLLSLFVAGCNGEQMSDSPSSKASQIENVAESNGDSTPELSIAVLRETSFQSFIKDFDHNSEGAIKDYFVSLLENGIKFSDEEIHKKHVGIDYNDPVRLKLNAISFCNRVYKNCCFYNVPVKVFSVEEGVQGYYKLELDVPQNEQDVLRPGIQTWYLGIGELGYDDYMVPWTLVTASRLSTREKYPFEMFLDDKIAYQIEVTRAFAYHGVFDSPKDIPKEHRANFLLLNVPPSGKVLETNEPYLTQAVLEEWSYKLFGEETIMAGDRIETFTTQTGENAYVLSIGWGPAHIFRSLIKRWDDSEGIHYYYELNNPDDWLSTTPQQILEYTVRDGIIWSCVDVSDIIKPSPYLNLE